MEGMRYCVCDTPIGPVRLEAEDGALTALRFLDGGEAVPPGDELLQEAARQLDEYFRGERRDFDLPIRPEGTDFQRRVWAALRTIPYGETRTYGDIARQLGKPGAARAVGQANHFNPLPVIVPCHRVNGAKGSLVGYTGGLERKVALLKLERGE